MKLTTAEVNKIMSLMKEHLKEMRTENYAARPYRFHGTSSGAMSPKDKQNELLKVINNGKYDQALKMLEQGLEQIDFDPNVSADKEYRKISDLLYQRANPLGGIAFGVHDDMFDTVKFHPKVLEILAECFAQQKQLLNQTAAAPPHPDSPFSGRSFRDELYNYYLENPSKKAMDKKTQELANVICADKTATTDQKIFALLQMCKEITDPQELSGSKFATLFGPYAEPPISTVASIFHPHPPQPYADALGIIKKAVLDVMDKAPVGTLKSATIDSAKDILRREKTAGQALDHETSSLSDKRFTQHETGVGAEKKPSRGLDR